MPGERGGSNSHVFRLVKLMCACSVMGVLKEVKGKIRGNAKEMVALVPNKNGLKRKEKWMTWFQT
jgi:hypothetical protein